MRTNGWTRVEEESGSNFSGHDKDNIGVSATTIEMDKDAKASLEEEMKGKTTIWKVSTPAWVTEPIAPIWPGRQAWLWLDLSPHTKIAMDFSQNKKDLSVERKKTVLLEQCLR
jgi:hypothetical protein